MSPIPDFNHNNVLPPHLGNPSNLNHISPFPCTILELCERFSTSIERIEILSNFLAFRKKMRELGIVNAFQWIDGSFTENIEKIENRSPRDIDVVTLYGGMDDVLNNKIKAEFVEFFSPVKSKEEFSIDHYAFDITHNALVTVKMTKYWTQLFSHGRSGIWKGMLEIEVNTEDLDLQAEEYLAQIEL